MNRAAPEGLSEVTIAAGENVGIHMLLDLKKEKDYWLGTYEPELQAVISDLVKPGQIVYDIGANIGFITLLFTKRIGDQGHVYAFEALPANVSRLIHNIELNALEEWVTIIQAAVQDQSGQAEFLVAPSTGMGKVNGSAGRASVDYEESIQVEGISIDGFIEDTRNLLPDILKIDIEGGEVLALPGMVKLLHAHRPILLIELHGIEAAQVTWDHLKQENYRICRMEPEYPQVDKVQDLNWKSYLVAFPNE
ncbi:MAG: FkbM family methyltransferase [Chloroflexi bacterium]|nr:FkbM family methyltransferase [Chloroflexota bacterium]